MPRRKGPAMSRSLFASLPHELRETIRIQGALPAVTAPHVTFTQLQDARSGERAGGSSYGIHDPAQAQAQAPVQAQELVRTQPESLDGSDSEDSSESEEEEQELVEEKASGAGSLSQEKAVSSVAGGAPAGSGSAPEYPTGKVPSVSPLTPVVQPGSRPESTVVPSPSISVPTVVPAIPQSTSQARSAVRSRRTEGTWVPSDDYDPIDTVPRKKRRKTNGACAPTALPNAYAGHPYDCTGLVPRYNDYKEVPADIRKYYAQRKLMFAEYDELPLLLDHTGWFSVTPQPIAQHIAERCRCDVIVDAFCGIGGNAIEFAKTCERVIAIDNDLTRLKLARHNALQYGVADRIEFIHGSYVDFARAYAASTAPDKEAINVVFLSPPWGGVDYLTFTADPLPFPPSPLPLSGSTNTPPIPTSTPSSSASAFARPAAPPKYPLSAVEPIHGADLFRLTAALTPNIAYYLPKNTNLKELAVLAPRLRPEADAVQSDGAQGGNRDREWVEVEEEWVGEKVKAVTAYYGSLVSESGMSG